MIHIIRSSAKFQMFDIWQYFPNQFLHPTKRSKTLYGKTQETLKDLKIELHN